MKALYSLFPLSELVASGDMRSLAVTLVIYVLGAAIMAILNVVLGWIPILGLLTQAASVLMTIYCATGAVLAVMRFWREA